jgi:fumarate reductase (CoM/CoB) subunit A
MASRCGAEIKDMEFIQFYPLLISSQRLPKILAPPSLVEKGKIVNDVGEDVLRKYGLTELRPIAIRGRDKLSAALYGEMMEGRKVYLDIRHVSSNDGSLESSDREMLQILEARYQSGSRPLPVMPCAHFTIGGIVIDENCRTSLEGLFAAGEVACGIHGTNRMGGNALTETLVFGYRAGIAAAAFAADCKQKSIGGLQAENLLESVGHSGNGAHQPAAALRILRDIMWENCGPVRSSAGLFGALERVMRLREEGISCKRPESLGSSCSVRNSLDTAKIIAESAIERKESAGAHYRIS